MTLWPSRMFSGELFGYCHKISIGKKLLYGLMENNLNTVMCNTSITTYLLLSSSYLLRKLPILSDYILGGFHVNGLSVCVFTNTISNSNSAHLKERKSVTACFVFVNTHIIEISCTVLYFSIIGIWCLCLFSKKTNSFHDKKGS